jgi:TrmH family RNA methyltransferase
MSRDDEFIINSPQNKLFKELKKMSTSNHFRRKCGLFLVEGLKENTLAMNAGFIPEKLFRSAGKSINIDSKHKCDLITLNDTLFDELTYRPQSVLLGLYKEKELKLDEIQLAGPALIIIAEAIEKPGNLGAILRTADAVRADALIVADPRTDFFNPNVIRSSVGTLFTVPTVSSSKEAILDWCRQNKLKVYAAALEEAVEYTSVDMRSSCALVFGTEDNGLSTFWLENVDNVIRIPMLGVNDSLNVSNSVAVIAYEAIRQRR